MGSTAVLHDQRLTIPSPNKTPKHATDSMSGLYWTLHDFDCKQQHVLSFKKNEVVEVTKASSSTNWHRGRINGRAGFLPANGYLKRINLEKCGKMVVGQEFEGTKPGQLTIHKGQVVTVIVKNDSEWWTVQSELGKWGVVAAKCLKAATNGSAAVLTNGDVIVHSAPVAESTKVKESTKAVTNKSPPPQVKDQVHPDVMNQEQQKSCDSKSPEAGTAVKNSAKTKSGKDLSKVSYDLVELVRKKGIKYQTSKEVVQGVLEQLMSDYPDWDSPLSELCTTLNSECEVWSDDPDICKLEQLFEHLVTVAEDEQQRGWICEDDTSEIRALLTDLLALLHNANPRVVVHVLETLKYEPLYTLVQYYQLEKRVLLKRLSLEVMLESMLIQPDPVCSILLASRLPVQLASDIQTCNSMRLLEEQCNVFCACLSYPNTMPANHYDQLDASFISHLLSSIENSDNITCDPDNKVPALFLTCLISLNLHYQEARTNKICSVLKSRSSATNLTELLLLHFNRSEDPRQYFLDHSVDSVKKIIADLFSSPDTSELFFTNDVKVLIEVLHRNVIDRPEGSQERVYYLRTLDLVIANTDYSDHYHYREQISDLLHKVLSEEGSLETECQTIAREMLKKHVCLGAP